MSLFCMSQSSVSFVISSVLHKSCLICSYIYKAYYGADNNKLHVFEYIGGGFHSCSIIRYAQMYARSINGTATLPNVKSYAQNGKPIHEWTFASRIEHRLGFATVPEPNSGDIPGRSYKRR